MKKKPVKKPPSRKKLKAKLDKIFSIYIRTKNADWRGNVTCVTCGCVKPIKEMQNGHFVPRSCMSLRWSEDNCFPQCVACNIFKRGNYTSFAAFLVRKFGGDRVIWLESQKHEPKKFTIKEMTDLINDFKEKIINL